VLVMLKMPRLNRCKYNNESIPGLYPVDWILLYPVGKHVNC